MGRPLRYLSACSGIEAASVAWGPLDWRPFGFAEIDRFPSALLAHRYPSVPNLGDMTRFKDWPDADLDLFVAGTPCQSFSVAGLRAGLADPRGNLALTYLAVADRYRPEWLVWENVPGVLSSGGGRDFGAFLGGLGQLGYGFAYRVLDAQYVRVDGFGRAVPQRRRRVFVVANSRSWTRAAAVLFEPESLRWDTAPRREAREGVALTIAGGARKRGGYSADDVPAVAFGGNDTSGPIDVATARNAHGDPHGRLDFESETFVVPVIARTLTRGAESAGKGGYAGRRQEDDDNLIAFNSREDPEVTFDRSGPLGASSPQAQAIALHRAVRRLTPRECERLQGFPDDYTAILYRGKPAADGPRYKALGNSMAVNVMRWLGHRIELVNIIAGESGCNRPQPADASQRGADGLVQADPCPAAAHSLGAPSVGLDAQQSGVETVQSAAQIVQQPEQVVRGHRV